MAYPLLTMTPTRHGVPPTVSVIVTTYNHAPYIGAALQSVLDQDYENREIIVVDDGSTDDTPSRVAAFGAKVVYLRQRNQGVAGSRNAGIRHAHGDLLAFLDGDDLWEPSKLSVQVGAARDHPDSGLIVADGVQFEGGRILKSSIIGPSIKALLGSSGSLTLRCYRELLEENLILSSSQVMMPKTALDEVGLSDLRIAHASDWDLYLRIAARYDVTFLNQTLTRWRYLPTSVSGPSHLRHIRWAPDEIAILKKQLRQASPDYRALIQRLLKGRTFERAYAIYSYGVESDKSWARAHLLKVLRQNPTSLTLYAFLAALHCPRSLNRRLGPMANHLLGQSSRSG